MKANNHFPKTLALGISAALALLVYGHYVAGAADSPSVCFCHVGHRRSQHNWLGRGDSDGSIKTLGGV